MDELTVAEVRAAFPELVSETYPDAAVTAAIATARLIAAATKTIWLHCVAHLLVLERTAEVDGGQGEVKSERLGPQQSEYLTQAETGREAFFTGTAYGRLVLTMESRSARSRLSVVFA